MKTTVILRILICLLAAAGIWCGYRYYGDVIRPEREIAAADREQTELFAQIRPVMSQPAETAASREASPAPAAPSPPQPEPLAPAAEVNSAVVGWITIPGTHIDYPIVQGDDNDFYLHHGFDGKPNQELGCPFLDCRCAGDFSGFNSIVYAHHMTKQRMFADIALFQDAQFLDSHSTGCLTLNDGTHEVRFFAYLNVPDTDALYQTGFRTDDEKQTYLDYVSETAVYTAFTGIPTDARLLLLSTCTFEFEGARGVLAGVIAE